MPLFSYHIRTMSGRSQRGTQEAASANALAASLRQLGHLVLEIRSASANDQTNTLQLLNPLHWLPVRSLDVELSLQQISVMLRNGVTLLSALKTVSEQARRPAVRRVWSNVADHIQQGSNLADALQKHSCFPHMVIHLVRVGEQTGTLDRVLDRASETLERRRLLKTQLLTALTYPIIVLIAAVGVATFMVLYVIPKIRVFLNSLGRKLPPLTQALVDISDFIQNYVLYFGVGAILLLVGFVFLYRWPPSRLTIDRVALRLPLLGHLLTLSSTAQFAHALSVMLRSGVTLVESLRTMELLQGNKYLAQRVAESRGAVLGGGSLGGTLLAQRTFMPMLAQMVTVGEQSGTLDDVLEDVAKFYEGQLQSTIKLFSSIIEPVIIAVVGGVVGFVYIAFFVALYSTTGPR